MLKSHRLAASSVGAVPLLLAVSTAVALAKPPVGTDGGQCYPNQTCNDYLQCKAGRCAPFGRGEESGPCFRNQTCNEGLMCRVRALPAGTDLAASIQSAHAVAETGDAEAAEAALLDLVSAGDAEPWQALAQLFEAQKRYADAVNAWKEFGRLRPGNRGVKKQLRRAKARLRRQKAAVPAQLEILARRPSCVSAEAAAALAAEAEKREAADLSCRKAASCNNYGLCFAAAKGGGCVAGSAEDCARSRSCKRAGKCDLLGNKCAPSSDVHCEQSKRCRRDGACAAKEGACRPGSDAHCQASKACRRDAMCGLNPSSGRCDLTDEGCRNAVNSDGVNYCEEKGYCFAPAPGVQGKGDSPCRPRSSSDCQASNRCRTKGTCNFNPGRYFGFPGFCEASTEACAGSEACRKCKAKTRASRNKSGVKFCPCWAKQEGKIKRCRSRN